MTPRDPATAAVTPPDAPAPPHPPAPPAARPSDRLAHLLGLVDVAEGALAVEAEIAAREDAIRIEDQAALMPIAAALAAQWDALDLPVITVRTTRGVPRPTGVFRKRVVIDHVTEYPEVRVLVAARGNRATYHYHRAPALLVIGLLRDGTVVVAHAPGARNWDVRRNDRVVDVQCAPTVDTCHLLDEVATNRRMNTQPEDARPFHTWDPAILGIEPAQVLEACRQTLARRLAALGARQAAGRAAGVPLPAPRPSVG